MEKKFKGKVCPFLGGNCTRTPCQNGIYFVLKFMGIHAHALKVCRKSETESPLQIEVGFHLCSFSLARAQTHSHKKTNKQLRFNNARK